MTEKAYKKLWMIRILILNGASLEELTDIDRLQKCFMHMVLADKYTNYEDALTLQRKP